MNVGKTTRSVRHDLNQIPCGYTVEVRNAVKGLEMVDKVPEEPWTEVCNIKGSDQHHPKEKKDVRRHSCCLRKLYKWQRKEKKIYPPECRVPENSKER